MEFYCRIFFTEYLYSCKAQDEQGQGMSCTSMELKEKEKNNTTVLVLPMIHLLLLKYIIWTVLML